MKMNKRMAAIIVAAALIIIGFGSFGFFRSFSKSGDKSGDVISVSYNPNKTEDGDYIIEVKGKYSQKYIINATGYISPRITPDSQGQDCLKMPEAKIGDKVSFKLPSSSSDKYDFTICYPRAETGYYFRVD